MRPPLRGAAATGHETSAHRPASQGPNAAAGGLPDFLRPLAARLRGSDRELAPPLRPVPEVWEPRRSAVLVLISGTTLEASSLLLEERSHTMRSQPGQFALPGGRVEPEDPDDVATALREAREETGLDPDGVQVVGSFAPIPMPWRSYQVRPVVAWASARPALARVDPAEVESLVWAPVAGPGSLTDPGVRRLGTLDGEPAGTAFDLPGDAFVWGFTAMILDAVLGELDAPLPRGDARPAEVPELRRRAGL